MVIKITAAAFMFFGFWGFFFWALARASDRPYEE